MITDLTWEEQRAGKWTASEIWKLFVEPRSKADKDAGILSETAESYVLEKAIQRKTGYKKKFTSKEMDHGIINEKDAHDAFVKQSNLNLTLTNKQFFAINEYAGASPDAVLYDQLDVHMVVDYKCPQPLNFFLAKKNWINHKPIDRMYFYQLQMQMLATKAPKACLVNYLADEFGNTYTGEVEHRFDLPLNERIFFQMIDADTEVFDQMLEKIEAAEVYCKELMKII
jgi:hypothetical protein